MLALDISNWGAGNPPVDLSAQTVAQWKAYAVRRIIVGVSHKVDIARQQLVAVTDGDLEAEAYIYMYWGQDPTIQVEYARQAIGHLPVGRLWVDFEDDNAPKDDPRGIVKWICRCLEAAGTLGLPLGIYTAWWWWTVWTDNTEDFKDYPLWVAAYDGLANGTFPHFGGWQACTLKQYAGTTDFCGYSADLDFYEEDDMADEEARRQIAIVNLADRWMAMIKLGQLQLVINEAKALGVVAQ